jgi:histidinol-phosphate aminotransferase
MKKYFKPFLYNIKRVQNRSGRDLKNGLRLDRNERVDNFSDAILENILKNIPAYMFNTYPETCIFYKKLSKFSGFPENQLFLTEGITGAMKAIFEGACSQGDNVIFPAPSYALYKIYANIYQTESRVVGYKKNYELNFEQLLEYIDEKTKVVFLPNPNQPIESFLNLDNLRIIADKCNKYGALFSIDECYNGYCESFASQLLAEYDNVIIMRTFSKSFGLASIRLGYMLSSAENIEYFSKTRGIIEMNTFSMIIMEYMLDHLEIITGYIEQIKKSREVVKQRFDELDIQYQGGNYGNFISVFALNNEKAIDLVSELKSRKIYVRGPFEKPFDNCVRITIGSMEIMEKFFAEFLIIYQRYL